MGKIKFKEKLSDYTDKKFDELSSYELREIMDKIRRERGMLCEALQDEIDHVNFLKKAMTLPK